MNLILLSLGVLFVSGFGAAALGRRPRAASIVAAGGAVAAAIIGLVPVIGCLATGTAAETLRLEWNVPLGAFAIGLDPLSAWFAAAILGLSALAAVYGAAYLQAYREHKNLGLLGFFYNVLMAGMLLTVVARNGVLFLVAWEVMALASYFLVVMEDEHESVRQAGWTYLVATHVGTAFLLVLFVMMAGPSGSMDFDTWTGFARTSGAMTGVPEVSAGLPSDVTLSHPEGASEGSRCGRCLSVSQQQRPQRDSSASLREGRNDNLLGVPETPRAPALVGVAFVLALVGFGAKAGFVPLHVWLPEAHPAAPSHVSAVMSGVMIKTGIYGLLRVLMFLGPPPEWWAWTLIAIGAVTGVLGILAALAQGDLKRLLAYSSVENIGVITLGLGVGLLGLARHEPAVAAVGLAGALLHVVNHAFFKSLLFMGAGAVKHAAGTLEIDRLGGLLKRMPVTGLTFVIAAAAISALPPLNGFVSEFLIYLGAYRGAVSLEVSGLLGGLAVIGGLALIGGLAAACFAKATGIAFLGEPRTAPAAAAHEVGWAMRGPMLILAIGCVAMGLAGPVMLQVLAPVVADVSGLPRGEVAAQLPGWSSPLAYVSLGAAIILVLAGLLALVRRALLIGREVGSTGTWDCGYVDPTARMQYTASSFAQPLTDLFRNLIGLRKDVRPPAGYLPHAAARFRSDAPDVFRRWLFAPVFGGAARATAALRWMQHGRIQIYVLYIALTLLVLLVWKLS